MSDGLILPEDLYYQMQAHVAACLPEEGCGLLAGEDGKAQKVIPIENQFHSPTRFRMEAKALLLALQEMETSRIDMVGIFHSHPSGPSHPSPTDLAENGYPDAYHLIWFQSGAQWVLRVFRMDNEKYIETTIIIVHP
jgi:proteasome lid subunit RPN8/RPN11